MNRMQYMESLAGHLQDLTEEERRDALKYYNSYFADAGPEHEEELMRELGTPEELASTIRAAARESDPFSASREEPKASDRALQTVQQGGQKTGNAGNRYTAGSGNSAGQNRFAGSGNSAGQNRFAGSGNSARQSGSAGQSYSGGSGFDQQRADKQDRTLRIVLIAAFLLVVSPVILSVAGAVIGILGAFFGAGFGMMVGGLIMSVSSMLKMTTAYPEALLVLGAGLLIFAIGTLLSTFGIWLCGKALPALYRLCVKLIRRILGKEVQAA